MGTTIYVDGGDGDGCQGCLLLIVLLFFLSLYMGCIEIKCKGIAAAPPAWEYHHVQTHHNECENRASTATVEPQANGR
jgi:hypothetical protein